MDKEMDKVMARLTLKKKRILTLKGSYFLRDKPLQIRQEVDFQFTKYYTTNSIKTFLVY